MKVAVTADLKAHVGKGSDLAKFLIGILGETRARTGCEMINLAISQDNPDPILIDERWATKEEHQAYMGWRQERGDIDTLVSFLASPPTITYFDIADRG